MMSPVAKPKNMTSGCDKMEITKDFIPEGRRNRPANPMRPRYITMHDTGNSRNGANARAHVNYLKGDAADSLPVSWHFTVDDENIIQHLPLDENGWHAGDGGGGTGNRQSIGIEICMNADGDRERAEQKAAELAAFLIKKVPTLTSFPECMKQHYDWSGKNCPPVLRAGKYNTWESFLDIVEGELGMEGLHWKQEQAIRMLESLAEKGLLNDPEQHIQKVKDNETLGDYVWLTLIERMARRLK